MRRSLVVVAAVLASLCVLAAFPSAEAAQAVQSPSGPTIAGTCALTSYTLTGSFTRVGGAASFNVDASGGCVGTPGLTGVTVSLTFNSVGPWSCVAGFALGSGSFQPSNGVPESGGASLTNIGGEYVIEMHALTGAAAGQIATLPVPCVEGQTQTTITGSGTLTFVAT